MALAPIPKCPPGLGPSSSPPAGAGHPRSWEHDEHAIDCYCGTTLKHDCIVQEDYTTLEHVAYDGTGDQEQHHLRLGWTHSLNDAGFVHWKPFWASEEACRPETDRTPDAEIAQAPSNTLRRIMAPFQIPGRVPGLPRLRFQALSQLSLKLIS